MTEKKVDESWKENVEKEKSNIDKQPKPSAEQDAAQEQLPPMDFTMFLSSLGMQALIALGEVENPVTNKKEADLMQAKYLIDIVGMMQEKTKGNLTDTEAKALDQILYELRSKYISIYNK